MTSANVDQEKRPCDSTFVNHKKHISVQLFLQNMSWQLLLGKKQRYYTPECYNTP